MNSSMPAIDPALLEIFKIAAEQERTPEHVLAQHYRRWQRACDAARVGGLLKITFSCERIPGDVVEISDGLVKVDVMRVNAHMLTRDRRKPRARKAWLVTFQIEVSIVATHRERRRALWRVTEEAYQHEAAELLTMHGRRITRVHRHGIADGTVGVP